jgi:hypothetical protein
MRRLRDEDGAVAVVVAILAIVLFGFGAFAIDISSLWSERRQLQSGADAASLAVAQLCVAEACDSTSGTPLARQYAEANALDDTANVEELCGSPTTGLPACSEAPASAPPGLGWVMVRTRTGDETGAGVVPPILAKVLVPDYDGTTIHASAIANYGAPGALTSQLPLIFSACEWEEAVGATDLDGTDATYAPSPPYTVAGSTRTWATDSAGASLERTIYFHDTTQAGTCPAGPAGSDLSGGFGWLQPDDGVCQATSTVDGWFDDKTGIAIPQDCSKDELAALIGQELFVPIYGATNGLTGTNGEYDVVGYAAFYLTGYSFPGAVEDSLVTGHAPCTGSERCISGFFSQGLVSTGSTGVVGNGHSLGANIVGLFE